MLRRRASNIPRLQRQPRRAKARLENILTSASHCRTQTHVLTSYGSILCAYTLALQQSGAFADSIRQRMHPRRPRISATRRTHACRLRNQSFYSLVVIKPSQRLWRQLCVVKLVKQLIKQLNKISTRGVFFFERWFVAPAVTPLPCRRSSFPASLLT